MRRNSKYRQKIKKNLKNLKKLSKKRLKMSNNNHKYRKIRKIPTKTSESRQNTDQNVERPSNRRRIVENR